VHCPRGIGPPETFDIIQFVAESCTAYTNDSTTYTSTVVVSIMPSCVGGTNASIPPWAKAQRNAHVPVTDWQLFITSVVRSTEKNVRK